jgi:hypothetical protein
MRWVRAVASLALATLVGCGSDEDNVRLIRVTGTITQNGKPLANAGVSFVPQTGNKDSTPGVDETGPEGNYMVKFKGRNGVAPGKYKVVVTPPDEVAASQVPEKFKNDPMMFRFMKDAQSSGKKSSGEKKAVAKSEFEAEVPDQDKPVVLDFDVKASASAGGTTTK